MNVVVDLFESPSSAVLLQGTRTTAVDKYFLFSDCEAVLNSTLARMHMLVEVKEDCCRRAGVDRSAVGNGTVVASGDDGAASSSGSSTMLVLRSSGLYYCWYSAWRARLFDDLKPFADKLLSIVCTTEALRSVSTSEYNVKQRALSAEIGYYQKQAHNSLGACIRVLGTELIVSLPNGRMDLLNVSMTDTEYTTKTKAWLLPLLQKHVHRDSLTLYVHQFLPLAGSLRTKSRDCDSQGHIILSRHYKILELQVWKLLPSFFREPLDAPAAFEIPVPTGAQWILGLDIQPGGASLLGAAMAAVLSTGRSTECVGAVCGALSGYCGVVYSGWRTATNTAVVGGAAVVVAAGGSGVGGAGAEERLNKALTVADITANDNWNVLRSNCQSFLTALFNSFINAVRITPTGDSNTTGTGTGVSSSTAAMTAHISKAVGSCCQFADPRFVNEQSMKIFNALQKLLFDAAGSTGSSVSGLEHTLRSPILSTTVFSFMDLLSVLASHLPADDTLQSLMNGIYDFFTVPLSTATKKARGRNRSGATATATDSGSAGGLYDSATATLVKKNKQILEKKLFTLAKHLIRRLADGLNPIALHIIRDTGTLPATVASSARGLPLQSLTTLHTNVFEVNKGAKVMSSSLKAIASCQRDFVRLCNMSFRRAVAEGCETDAAVVRNSLFIKVFPSVLTSLTHVNSRIKQLSMDTLKDMTEAYVDDVMPIVKMLIAGLAGASVSVSLSNNKTNSIMKSAAIVGLSQIITGYGDKIPQAILVQLTQPVMVVLADSDVRAYTAALKFLHVAAHLLDSEHLLSILPSVLSVLLDSPFALDNRPQIRRFIEKLDRRLNCQEDLDKCFPSTHRSLLSYVRRRVHRRRTTPFVDRLQRRASLAAAQRLPSAHGRTQRVTNTAVETDGDDGSDSSGDERSERLFGKKKTRAVKRLARAEAKKRKASVTADVSESSDTEVEGRMDDAGEESELNLAAVLDAIAPEDSEDYTSGRLQKYGTRKRLRPREDGSDFLPVILEDGVRDSPLDLLARDADNQILTIRRNNNYLNAKNSNLPHGSSPNAKARKTVGHDTTGTDTNIKWSGGKLVVSEGVDAPLAKIRMGNLGAAFSLCMYTRVYCIALPFRVQEEVHIHAIKLKGEKSDRSSCGS
eukprot:Lankesteria_metandrocarpae@DN5050_c0_g1_i3.p1